MSETEKRYVKTITDDDKQKIIDSSVEALSNRPTSNATELKMRFVAPIVNTSGVPCLADEVDRIANEANDEFAKLNKQAANFDIGLGVQLGLINKNEEAIEKAKEDISRLQIDVGGLIALPTQLSEFKDEVKYTKASKIEVSVHPLTFVTTFKLLTDDGYVISTAEIDLPLESMVIGAGYNKDAKSLILTLKSGEYLSVPLEDVFAGLINESEKGAPNGVTPLDENAKIPSQYLPDDIGGGASNIENGNGTNSVQQKASSGVENGFSFSDKTNAAAVEHDSTLNGTVPYGAQNDYSASFGCKSSAQGRRSFASGSSTVAKGDYSHTEGSNGVAFGVSSHVEGAVGTAIGDYSHVEGSNGVAKGTSSHVEGMTNTAEGNGSHAEGWNNTVKGNYAHAEGSNNTVGENAHSAHVSGQNNNVNYEAQAVFGRYNKNKPNNILEVGYGDGDAPSQRKNVFEVDKDGNAYAGGTRLLKEGEVSGGSTKKYKHTMTLSMVDENEEEWEVDVTFISEYQSFESLVDMYNKCEVSKLAGATFPYYYERYENGDMARYETFGVVAASFFLYNTLGLVTCVINVGNVLFQVNYIKEDYVEEVL